MNKHIEKIAEEMLQKEWKLYNEFLDKEGISVLPDFCMKDGNVLTHEKVREMYKQQQKL